MPLLFKQRRIQQSLFALFSSGEIAAECSEHDANNDCTLCNAWVVLDGDMAKEV
jgi:hypothetical protein